MTNTSPMSGLPADKLLSWPKRNAPYAEGTWYWSVAVVAPQREKEALRQLEERGHEARIEFEIVWRWNSPSDKRTPGKKKVRCFNPVFPGYVFVGVRRYRDLAEIRAMDIIQRILGSGVVSSRLTKKDMRRLAEMAEKIEAPAEQSEMISREEYKIGDLCEVVSGPLTSQQLTVEDITGTGTASDPYMAVVTPGFFNEAKPIKVALDTLKPV